MLLREIAGEMYTLDMSTWRFLRAAFGRSLYYWSALAWLAKISNACQCITAVYKKWPALRRADAACHHLSPVKNINIAYIGRKNEAAIINVARRAEVEVTAWRGARRGN